MAYLQSSSVFRHTGIGLDRLVSRVGFEHFHLYLAYNHSDNDYTKIMKIHENHSHFAGRVFQGVLLAFLILPGVSWGAYQTCNNGAIDAPNPIVSSMYNASLTNRTGGNDGDLATRAKMARTVPQYWEYDYGRYKAVRFYGVRIYCDWVGLHSTVKDWTLYGCTDGGSWQVIRTGTCADQGTSFQAFSINDTGQYRRVRFQIDSCYQTNTVEPGFKEIEFDAVVTDNTPDPCLTCEPVVETPQWFSDWTGQYYDTYDEFRQHSTVALWTSTGPEIVISKRELTRQAGLFGVILSGILVLALYLAVL